MNIQSTLTAPAATAREAHAALQAITTESRDENARQITELSQAADALHVTEHIRGMVAATMGHVSADASALTREQAAQWQAWALGVADGVAQAVPAGA